MDKKNEKKSTAEILGLDKPGKYKDFRIVGDIKDFALVPIYEEGEADSLNKKQIGLNIMLTCSPDTEIWTRVMCNDEN